jgi:hypothetical protein
MTYVAAQWREKRDALFQRVTAKHISEAMG